MLPREHRLSAHKDIVKVAASKRRFITPFFSVCILPGKMTATRIAFVVSTKIGKRANTRNLLKRRLRAACAVILPQIEFPLDMVVFARTSAVVYSQPRKKGIRTPPAHVMSYKEIQHQIARLLEFLKRG